VLPDDVPAHPYGVAMETVQLAPNAEASIYPWKETGGSSAVKQPPRAKSLGAIR
jgi:hypothetical protein